MKVLAVGDPHIQVKHLDDAKLFTDRLIDLAKKQKPDIIVILGDVLHTHERLHTQALNHARSMFMRAAKQAPTFVLVGNHDYINNSQRLTDNHWMVNMRELPGVTVVDRVVQHVTSVGSLILSPYVPDGEFHAVLEESKLPWSEARAIFAHQLFDGAKMGAITASGVEEWTGPLCISGHIHDKQRFGERLHYVGASFAHAFGDSAEKTVSVYTFTEDEVTYEDFTLDMPRLITMRGAVADAKELMTKILERNKADANRYRLVLTGDPSEVCAMKKLPVYKLIQASTVKLVIRTTQREAKNDDEQGLGDAEAFTLVLYNLLHTEEERRIATAALDGSLIQDGREDAGPSPVELNRTVRPRVQIVVDGD